MRNFMIKLVKFMVSQVFTKDLMVFVVENVEFYMNDTNMSGEQKAQIVRENAIERAKALGISITVSGINLLIETAVSYVKSK
mgnify:CR=1 FL=1